jgi:hypothetical protein
MKQHAKNTTGSILMRSIDVRLRKLEATAGYSPLVALRFIDAHEDRKTHPQEYPDDLVISRIVISTQYQRPQVSSSAVSQIDKTMEKQI